MNAIIPTILSRLENPPDESASVNVRRITNASLENRYSDRMNGRIALASISLFVAFVATAQTTSRRVIDAAIEQTQHRVVYDGTYVKLAYPGGDVAPDRGVCSDVVIRAYRAAGIDLQKLVHEDMVRHFDLYPHRWSLNRPDSNIDHRRVPNLATFFSRFGTALPKSSSAGDYAPGDIVTWDLGGGVPHIGIVTDRRDARTHRPLVVHNIGRGPQLEDVLFAYRITGHFRYPRGVD